MKKLFIISLLFLTSLIAVAQEVKEMERPRLVVGLVVDQMRWDYLTRFYDRYTDGGFRRLMADGYNCNRLQINYIPTVTAVGHTSVYTGSVPAFTGIVGNTLHIDGKLVTSVADKSVRTIGNDGKVGQASPHNLLVTTMTDELRLATNFRAKTIGVALKDRAAILPAGHSATAAYWFDRKELMFVSSSYYMDNLPQWAKAFNDRKLGDKYAKKLKNEQKNGDCWKLLYDEASYVQSTSNKHERYFDTIGESVNNSPYGNTLTADMAIAAIDGENMGRNEHGVPDFLAVSFSSTDMVGHNVGPNSIWIEDVYLRLDREIARILSHLDATVGKGNYVVFLTADHAGAHNIEFRRDHKLPADKWAYYQEQKALNDTLAKHFGVEPKMVVNLDENNVFFDNAYIRSVTPQSMTFKEYKKKVMEFTIDYIESLDNVAYCFEFRNIPTHVPEPVRTMAANGYNPKRSGDLQIVLEANVTEDFEDGYDPKYNGISKGTQHCVWSPYDAHIPFIVMGKNVRHAWDEHSYHITDIAPTICSLLNIQQPSGCVGDVIQVKAGE